LIRGRHGALHRRLGRLSFGLVPAIVVVTVNLIYAWGDFCAWFLSLPLS